MISARLWFWLRVMDSLHALGAWRARAESIRWRAYLWAVGKASDAEWGG